MTDLSVVLVLFKMPDPELARLRETFRKVHYHPTTDTQISDEDLKEVDVINTHPFYGIPPYISTLAKVPKLRLLQNAATGVERVLKSPCIASATPEQLTKIKFANSAGGYSLHIAGFVLHYITGLFNFIPTMTYIQRSERRWAEPEEINPIVGVPGPYGSIPIYGKTFGFLGYGSLGREFARICSIFPESVLIAANSEGKRKSDDTFIMEGCGDTQGLLPSEFYSTRDPESFKEFLFRCDVLVASLPSTKHTTGLLDAEKLGWMKPGAIFINVGRGTLIKNEELLKALDNGLWGAALDVTDPEPLTADHPLWSHPRVIITPHLSGETKNELTQSTSILLRNVKNINEGKDIYNSVSFEKGY